MVTRKENAIMFWFYIACAVLMSAGFASIIALAGELVNRETFEKKDGVDT